MKIKSVYGTLMGSKEEYRLSLEHAMHFTLEMEDKVDGERLQKAMDQALVICPYMTYDMVVEDGYCYFTDNDRPVTVQTEMPKQLGEDSLGGHLFCVLAGDHQIKGWVSHALTDGAGTSWFLSAMMQFYFEVENPDLYTGRDKDDYFGDLLKEPLPVSENYIFRDYRVEPSFRIPEAGKFRDPGEVRRADSRPYFFSTLSLSLEDVDRFCALYRCSHSVFLFYMLARTVARIHPENGEPVAARMPVNARRFFGMDNSFQNASANQIVISLKPEDLKEREEGELIAELKASVKKQVEADHLAYCLNQYRAHVTKEGDTSHLKEIISLSGQSIMLTDMGMIFPEEVNRRLDQILINTYSGGQMSFFFATRGNWIDITWSQLFEDPVYREELVKVLREYKIRVS